MEVEKEKQYASPADAKYVTVVKPLYPSLHDI